MGRVRLVRKANGQHDLAGGLAEDREIARTWCKQFAPDLAFVPQPVEFAAAE